MTSGTVPGPDDSPQDLSPTDPSPIDGAIDGAHGSGRFTGLRAAMEEMSWKHGVRKLLRLLSRERIMLKTGDVAGLAGLDRERARLADFVTRHRPQDGKDTRDLLTALHAEATRNHKLLSAFLDGLQKATAQSRDQLQAGARIGLYSAQGGPVEAPTTVPISDRRA